EQDLLDNVAVPVRVSLAPGQTDRYSLDVAGPSQVLASFAGPASRLRELRGMLQRGELFVDAILDVPEAHQSEARYQDVVRVEQEDTPARGGVTPILVEGRNRTPVTLHRLVERRLPVRLVHGPDDAVSQAAFDPPTVVVRGPQDVLDRLRAVPTQPV